jgi:hypothetical protein
VFLQLTANVIKKFPIPVKYGSAVKDPADFFPLYLTMLNGNGSNLVCQHICSIPVRGHAFDLICTCLSGYDQGFEKVIKPGCKDCPPGDGIQLVTGPPDPLDKPGYFAGRAKLYHMVDSADIYSQLHG